MQQARISWRILRLNGQPFRLEGLCPDASKASGHFYFMPCTFYAWKWYISARNTEVLLCARSISILVSENTHSQTLERGSGAFLPFRSLPLHQSEQMRIDLLLRRASGLDNLESLLTWRVRKTLCFWDYLCDSISPALIVDNGR